MDSDLRKQMSELLESSGLSDDALEGFASNLVWRIGRTSDDAPVTVRVGLASSAALFGELPKLRNASESEIEAAIAEDAVRVEWIGQMPR